MPLVAILTIDARPFEIGVLSALSVAPGVFVGLLLGGWVDRSAKRPILIGADLVRAALLATVPVAAYFDFLAMPQLYLVAAGVGAATVLFQIADHAYLPALLGKSDLLEGNAKLGTTDAIAEIGGPSLAGILVGLVTAPMALAFDAVSYVISAAFLRTIRRRELPTKPEAETQALGRDFWIGLRAGFGHRLVRPLMMVDANTAFFGGFYLSLYMIYMIETLALPPAIVGTLIGVGGVGALFGAIISRHLQRYLGVGPALVVLLAVGQSAALLIPLASGPEWVVVSCLAVHQLLGDAMLVAYYIQAVSLRQTVLPQHVLARANAATHVFTGVLVPLGALAAGGIASAVDVRAAVWTSVLGGLAAPVILATSPILRLRELPIEGP